MDGTDKIACQIYMDKTGFRDELLTNDSLKTIYISNYRDKNDGCYARFIKYST